MKLSIKQKTEITKKLLSYGFFEFQIPTLLKGQKVLTSFGHAQIKKPTELHVYTQYNDSTTVYNL